MSIDYLKNCNHSPNELHPVITIQQSGNPVGNEDGRLATTLQLQQVSPSDTILTVRALQSATVLTPQALQSATIPTVRTLRSADF